jgi:hypothetical protein
MAMLPFPENKPKEAIEWLKQFAETQDGEHKAALLEVAEMFTDSHEELGSMLEHIALIEAAED